MLSYVMICFKLTHVSMHDMPLVIRHSTKHLRDDTHEIMHEM